MEVADKEAGWTKRKYVRGHLGRGGAGCGRAVPRPEVMGGIIEWTEEGGSVR